MSEGGGMDIGAIVGRLVLQDEFSNKLDEAAGKAKKSITGIQLGMAAAAGTVIAFGAAILESAKKTAEMEDAQVKMAQASGVTVQAIQALSYAAKMSGVDTQVLSKSLKELAAPSDKAKQVFQQMGIALTDVNGKQRDSVSVMKDFATHIKNIDDPAQKTAATLAVFGNRAGAMVSLLDEGADGIDHLMKEAEDLGLVMSDEAAKNAVVFADSLETLENAHTGLSNSIGNVVIKVLNETGAVKALTAVIQTVTKWINNMSSETKTMIAVTVGVTLAVAAATAGFIAFQAILAIIGPTAVASMAAIAIPVAAVAAGITLLVITATALPQAFDKMGKAGVAALAAIAAIPIVGQMLAMIAVIATVVRHWDDFKARAAAVFNAWQPTIDKITAFVNMIESKLSGAIGKFASALDFSKSKGDLSATQTILLGIIVTLEVLRHGAEALYTVFSGVFQLIKGVGEVQVGLLTANKEMIMSGIEDSKNAIGKSWENLKANYTDMMTDISNQVGKGFDITTKKLGELGTAGGKEFTKNLTAQMEGWSEALAAKLTKSGTTNLSLVTIAIDDKHTAEDLAKIVEHVKNVAAVISLSLSDAWNVAQQSFNLMISQMQAKLTGLQTQMQKFDYVANMALAHLQKEQTAEVDAVTKAWDAKIKVAQQASAAIQAINDKAFAKQKAQMDLAYKQYMAQQMAMFKLKVANVKAESVNSTQAAENEALMQQDYDKWAIGEDAKHAQEVADAKAQQDEDTATQQAAANDAEKALEQQKADDLKAIQDRQAQQTKDTKKGIAAVDYMMALQSFAVSQAMARSQAQMALATTIMSAVQAGAALTAGLIAAFPLDFPLAIASGIGLTAMMSGLAYGGFQASLAAISSAMPPTPSADVFASEGAVLAGGPSTMDNIHAMVSPGESIISASRTEKMMKAIDNGTMGGKAFGDIHIHGDVDSDARAEKFAQLIAVKIQRRRY